jgi:hypothetical protein
VHEDGLYWTADLDAAIRCAHKNNRQVLVASEGITDVNCLVNKRTLFRDKAIQANLRRYVLVVHYLDFVPPEYYRNPPEIPQSREDALANAEWQRKTLGTEQEPLYTVLQPTTDATYRVVGLYDEGRISDGSAFYRFLRNPQSWRDNGPAPIWRRIIDFVKWA